MPFIVTFAHSVVEPTHNSECAPLRTKVGHPFCRVLSDRSLQRAQGSFSVGQKLKFCV
jgi:hypothetical protein